MAAAVLHSAMSPFHKSSNQRLNANSPIPSASSSSSRPTSSQPLPPSTTTQSPAAETTSRPFQRLRSSLEQSLRTATRSKKAAPPPPSTTADDFATLSTSTNGSGYGNLVKGKERERSDATTTGPEREQQPAKHKPNVLRRVTFGKDRGDTPSPAPGASSPSQRKQDRDKDSKEKEKERGAGGSRLAGFTSFITPSLRQASMSSPALHMSSQAIPSPRSQPAVPGSSADASALVSPTRHRSRKASLQPQSPSQSQQGRIGSPLQLSSTSTGTSKHEAAASPSGATRHRSTKSYTPGVPIPASPSTPTLQHYQQPLTPTTGGSRTRRDRERDIPGSPPDTPTPASRAQRMNSLSTSKRPSTPTTPTPISSSPNPHPNPNTSSSPLRSASQTRRVVTPRGLTSASTSHLPSPSQSSSSGIIPIPSPPSTPTHRRPSFAEHQHRSSSSSVTGTGAVPGSQRRVSIDQPRRTSIDNPRRTSIDQPNPRRTSMDKARERDAQTPSPVPASPTRARAISPTQRSYAQNRHFNISSGSLVLSPPVVPLSQSPSSPGGRASSPRTASSPTPQPQGYSETRELIRTATSMICREVVKPPVHMVRTEQGMRDWEEVEVRTRALVRLERIWGRSGGSTSTTNLGSGFGSSTNLVGNGGQSGSSQGEERERRLFVEALRDGYVLCQLINKLRSSTIVRPDAREDGFVRTSNITKFLAACASYGLSLSDLFQRDDLIEGSQESVARVAGTVIALIRHVDTPAPSRMVLRGGREREGRDVNGSAGSSGMHVAVAVAEKQVQGAGNLKRDPSSSSAGAAQGSGKGDRHQQQSGTTRQGPGPQGPLPALPPPPPDAKSPTANSNSGMATATATATSTMASTTTTTKTIAIAAATPYGTHSHSRASASTPNLSTGSSPSQGLLLPVPGTSGSPMRTKRWSPPEDMTPLRSDSPGEDSASGSGGDGTGGSGGGTGGSSPGLRPPHLPFASGYFAHGGGGGGSGGGSQQQRSGSPLRPRGAEADRMRAFVLGGRRPGAGAGAMAGLGADSTEFEDAIDVDDSATDTEHEHEHDAEFKPIPVPQLMKPPPRSPLRKQSSSSIKQLQQLDPGGLFSWAKSAASPQAQVKVAAGDGGAKEKEKEKDMVGELPNHLRSGRSAQYGHGHSQSTGNLNLGANHHHSGYVPNYNISNNTSNSSGGNSNSNYPYAYRQSVASSALSEGETSVTTAVSSLLDGGRSSSYGGPGSTGGGYMYGTIRTMTTDLTSEADVPSVSRTEGSFLVEEMAKKRSMEGGMGGGGGGGGNSNGSGMGGGRERKLSVLDLSRVAEEKETDESVSSKGGGGGGAAAAAQRERDRGRSPADKERPVAQFNLRKGKWPDDFMDAFTSHPTPAQPIPAKRANSSAAEYYHNHQEERERSRSRTGTPVSVSPPRKLAIVGPRRSADGGERGEGSGGGGGGGGSSSGGSGGLVQFPRRPSHRPRHSIDTPVLLPKESMLRREASPDGGLSSPRVMIRRHSTKPSLVGVGRPSGYGRNNSNSNFEDQLLPATPTSDTGSDPLLSAPVPFPRTASGEHGTPSPRSSGGEHMLDRPRVVRGRFQSEVDGSSARRKARPSSYDELGAKPARSRFESMVNLGVASGTTSASDLMTRDSMDGSAVRMRLVVREDGKPPTHFQLGNCIGRGQFGSVYRALNLNTGQMVAVKRIRLEGLKEEEVTTLMREVDLVKSLSHPSIVKYEGMARDDDTLNIVLEYAENGSLGQTLKAFGKLNERLVASYVVKILEGLHYLHTSDVVHCDLKAANILTTKNGNVKLSDFGVSLNLRAMEREIKDVAGTPNWMAPEVIELKGASTKADIWSLGCTVIELLTGRPPYAEIANTMSVMFRIVEDPMPPLPAECSELLKDFLEQCFDKDPAQRPSAEELCEHPWLKKNWVALKELRPQDSIPFLRRVSTDLQKSDAIRYLSQLDIPESPLSASPLRDEVGKITPIGRRTSASSIRPDGDFSPREHTFVKTTFSKPMICRVCLLNVKKTAVLCSQCSLISHSKCAVNAPPTCDLRAQLLLYAQYAEKGNPSSAYSNPADNVNDTHQNVAMSDVPFVEYSRTSLDLPQPPRSPAVATPIEHPPTAFKFMAAFKRSRTSLTPEPGPAPSTSSLPLNEKEPERKHLRKRASVAQNRSERPLSATSSSTGLSSLRSAATANESFSSRQNTGHRSQKSGSNGRRPASGGAVLDNVRPPKVTSARSEGAIDADDIQIESQPPGALQTDPRRQKKRASSSGNCTVQ